MFSSFSIAEFVAFASWEYVILSKLIGIKMEDLGNFLTGLQNPMYLNTAACSTRIADRILHNVLTKEQRNEVKKMNGTKQNKICLIAMLVLRIMIATERVEEEFQWEINFHENILPALRAHKKAKMEYANQQEMNFLIAYYRAMTYLSRIMTAANNKLLFIHVAAMLEGSFKEYVTGGQNTAETERREFIFQLVTNVTKRNRKPSPSRKTYTRNSKKQQQQNSSWTCSSSSSSSSICSSPMVASLQHSDAFLSSVSEDEELTLEEFDDEIMLLQ